MNLLDHARRLWLRYAIPPASAELAVVSLEHGATLTVPRGDVRHIVKVAERERRLPVLESRPTGDGMVRLRKVRKPRRKKL